MMLLVVNFFLYHDETSMPGAKAYSRSCTTMIKKRLISRSSLETKSNRPK
jgi:hypothetical protein